jgi:predicted DNA-binding transcriptional regulator YafY
MAEKTKGRRLVEIYIRLLNGERLSIPDIMEEQGVDRRTASRDLNVIRELGLAIEPQETDSRIRYWQVPKEKRDIRVTYSFRDVMSLFMGRRFFDFLENTTLQESFDNVYGRVEKQLLNAKDLDNARKLSQKVYLVHEGPKKLPKKARETLDECLSGLIHEKKLAIRYRNSKGDLRKYKVHPYTLVAYKRGLYLVAKAEENERTMVLSLERITSAEWLKSEPFKYPRKFDPERFFGKAMFIMPGDPEEVELLFTKTTEPFIRIRHFHPTQNLTKAKDGRLKMTLKVPVSEELVNWVASYREHVEVLSPENLRKRMKESLKKALQQYET